MKNFSFCAVDVLGLETRKRNTLDFNERTFEKSFDDCNYKNVNSIKKAFLETRDF